MAALIALAILALPLVEIAVFIQVGEWIGVWPTIGLTVLSTVVGSTLLRHQGLATIARANQMAERGEPPVDEILDGLCILLAAALLIVPGFVTDALGLLLFIPWVRRHVRRLVWRTFATRGRGGRSAVIEAEYVVIKEEGSDAKSHSPTPEQRQVSSTSRGDGGPS